MLCNLQPTSERLKVQVTDGQGASTLSSRLAYMIILTPPSIIQPPVGASRLDGENYSASAEVTGASPLAYQWYFNGLALPGETNASLKPFRAQPTNAGQYHLVVANRCGSAVSEPAGLQVIPATTFSRITTGPLAADLGESGTVIGDYDGDGFLDAFAGRWFHGQSALYRNNRDGTFSGVTNATFPMPVGGYWFTGCGDYDDDGRLDFLTYRASSLTTYAPIEVYYGKGDGTFAPVPLDVSMAWQKGAVDYDQDGLLDIYFVTDTHGGLNQLHRNLGGRRFQRMTSAEVGAVVDYATVGGAAWADYDDDGWLDVCAPDGATQTCRMFRNTGQGRFVSVTNAVTLYRSASYVSAWIDYDNDGRVDLFRGGYHSVGSPQLLFRNMGRGNFERRSVGLPNNGGYLTASWADYDNDGFIDVFFSWGDGNHCFLYRNNGNGTFTSITHTPIDDEIAAANVFFDQGKWFDYDNDGFLDLLVTQTSNPGGAAVPHLFFHNQTNENTWLKVSLVGTLSSRAGAGAKVRVKSTCYGVPRWQRRDITPSGDAYIGNGPIAHFGLGTATNVETVRVEWPSGLVTETHGVAVRQHLTVTEPVAVRVVGMQQGAAQIQVTAHPGMSIRLEASSNLVDWVSWQTVPQTNRVTPVVDPDAARHSHRFYKARVQ